MGQDATARRRWFGGIVLTTALVMLVCGTTEVPSSHLAKVFFLIYWLICFVLTGLAAIIGLRDLQEVQRRTRQEQRDLLETTLKDIEDEARSKKGT